MPSPPFDPKQYEPLMPFFDVECGEVKKIYDGPRIPVGFRITQNENKAFMVDIDFFDASGHKVEQAFAKESEFRFKFGYKGAANYESKWYTVIGAKLQSFQLSKQVKVCGFLVGEAKSMTSINPQSGTIKDLIDEICQLHDIDVTYTPPFSTDKMVDSGYNNADDTAISEKLHMKLANETDKNFIIRMLRFARDDQGRGGYMAIWGQKDGKDTLDIRLPEEENTGGLRYEYPCTDVKNVIDWQPSIEIMMGAISGSTGMQVNGYEQSTGNQMKFALDPALTKDYQSSFGNPISRPVVQSPDPGEPSEAIHKCSETMDETVVTNTMRSMPAGTVSAMARANLFLNFQLQMAQSNNLSTLFLIGDPGIDETYIGKVLEMKSYYEETYDPESKREPHWSTGKWLIEGFEHDWQQGATPKTLLFCKRVGSEGLLPGQPVEGGSGTPAATGGDPAQTEVGGIILPPGSL